MDSDKIRQIRDVLTSHFAAIEKETGCKVKQGTASYCSTSVSIKLDFSEIASDGLVLSKDANAFKKLEGTPKQPQPFKPMVTVPLRQANGFKMEA